MFLVKSTLKLIIGETLISNSGIHKLEQLLCSLETVSQCEDKDCSPDSKAMLAAVQGMATQILANNSLCYWLERSSQEYFSEQLRIIDNERSHYTVRVFNLQSQCLALILAKFIGQIDFNQDLSFCIENKAILKLLKLNKPLVQYQAELKQHLELSAEIYQFISTAPTLTKLAHKLSVRFIEIKSSYLNNYGGNLITAQNYQQAKKAYEDMVVLFFDILRESQLPVMYLFGKTTQLGSLRLAMGQSLFIKYWLSDELKMNQQLLAQGLAPFDAVFTYAKKLSCEQKLVLNQAAFSEVINNYQSELETYLQGEHLFKKAKGVSKDKKKLLIQLGKRFEQSTHLKSDAINAIFETIGAHEALVSADDELSLGRSASFLLQTLRAMWKVVVNNSELAHCSLLAASLREYHDHTNQTAQTARLTHTIC